MTKILLVSLFAIFVIKLIMPHIQLPFNQLEYVITETGTFDSLDPLDADKTQNLPVARMLYATPIEIDKNGKLSSAILSDFFYDEQAKQLSFSINKEASFSDNKPIRSKDIVITILRMLYFRPDFPVIKDIIGKNTWLNHKSPLLHLPQGISFDENQIKISFSKNVPNALFRFSLELFSIIPFEAINLQTGKLNNQNYATSGLYIIHQHNSNQITFELRNKTTQFNSLPSSIIFKYKKIADLEKKDLNPNTIISGNEADLIYSSKKKLFNSFNMQWLPSARFATMRLNTHFHPFNNSLCRIYFNEQIRMTIANDYPHIKPESSLFTNLIPGYIDYTEMKSELYKLTPNDEKTCLEKIKSSEFHLAENDNNTLKLGVEIILHTLNRLGVKNTSIQKGLSNAQITEKFASGKLSIISGASGFWALDPVGDVEMYFTKNLHKTLKYVWEDQKLYSLIEGIDQSRLKSSLESINKHIFLEGHLGIYMHFRRFYATHEKFKIEETASSISVSPPWLLNLVPAK